MMEWWLQLRHAHNSLKQKGIDSTFMLITWSIWKERNSRTFDSAPGRYEMHMDSISLCLLLFLLLKGKPTQRDIPVRG
uniref:Uncharacterized protein n=1 Tax=Setaria viridis TaxID=4556 RepID=A0A4V6D8U1_SETVI|nr:hypothetical protein SEVIR_4G282800v2 [Setaria viridis]